MKVIEEPVLGWHFSLLEIKHESELSTAYNYLTTSSEYRNKYF